MPVIVSLVERIGACSLLLLMAGGTACQPGKPRQEERPLILPPATSSRPVSILPTAVAPRPAPDDPDRVIDDDLTHVDPQAIAPQARAVALRKDAHAVLIRVSTRGTLDGGTLNLLGDGSVLYHFEFLYYDKSQPPGLDKRDGVLWVYAEKGRFSVTKIPHAIHLSRPTPYEPVPDPRCSLRAVWRRALASGVPANAVARAEYAAAWPGGPGSAFVWTIRVEGHQELQRTVDDRSCAPSEQPSVKVAGPRKATVLSLPSKGPIRFGAPDQIF